jgi:hypothetical protein
MPISPRLAGAGYPYIARPLVLAGTGYLDNAELGFSTAANAITAAVPVNSNAILVSGFNGFMVVADLSGNYNISLIHCDPTTDAVLTTLALRAAVPGAGSATLPTQFGAFSVGSIASTVSNVFMVIRLQLQGNGADRTLTAIRMWCGTR